MENAAASRRLQAGGPDGGDKPRRSPPAWRMLRRAAGFRPAVRTAGINPAARQNLVHARTSNGGYFFSTMAERVPPTFSRTAVTSAGLAPFFSRAFLR